MDKNSLERPWLDSYDAHVPASLDYPNITVNALLERAIKTHATKPFIKYEDHIFTYAQIGEFVDRVKYFLTDRGLKKGDRVALVLPNIPQFVIAYYGILAAGGIVVAMNPRYTRDEYKRLMEQAKVDYVFCLDGYEEIFQDLISVFDLKAIIITAMDDLSSPELQKKRDVNDSKQRIWLMDILYADTEIPHDATPLVLPHDDAIFQFSGGTIGYPKPAIGTHQNIVANAIQFSRWCDLVAGEEKVLAAIPLYHVYGMVLALNMGVAVGAEVVLISDPTQIENILKKIEENEITFYPGVPTMYHAINQNPLAKKRAFDLTSIKACISGSFTLHPQIKADFEEITDGKLIEGYGLSEAPTATHCNPLYGENKVGSIGLPLPDVEAKIVDLESGEVTLDAGEIGELVIRGPQVMRGYFEQEEETKNTLRDGWLFTGDIAKIDEDGYFFLVDRKKSLIKVNGLQVWPNEVENVVSSHPSIRACGVGGIPDQEQGERVVCWVVLEEGAELDEEGIRNWCKQKISSYKVPREFLVVESLPRTGVGKILRRELISSYKKNAGL